jgi:hypothetical protein
MDLGHHGWIAESGEIELGCPTVQLCDVRGAWEGTRRICSGELSYGEEKGLRAATQRVAVALRREGYFGPFGVDAFRFQEGAKLRLLSDLNARYSMGWGIGMGVQERKFVGVV